MLVTTLRLNDDDYKRLKDISENEQRSVNNLLNLIIKTYLKNHDITNVKLNGFKSSDTNGLT